jgi:hypothetical protein
MSWPPSTTAAPANPPDPAGPANLLDEQFPRGAPRTAADNPAIIP